MASIAGSLPEGLFLLACGLGGNRARADVEKLGLTLRAAFLADLRLRGRLADDGGFAHVLDPTPTGDRLLDAVLDYVDGAPQPESWEFLIWRDRVGAFYQVRDRLEAEGQIIIGPRRFLRSATITVCEPGQVRWYADTVRSVLSGPASQADPYAAAALALAAAGELKTVLARRDRRQHRTRIRELTADPIASALGSEIAGLASRRAPDVI